MMNATEKRHWRAMARSIFKNYDCGYCIGGLKGANEPGLRQLHLSCALPRLRSAAAMQGQIS